MTENTATEREKWGAGLDAAHFCRAMSAGDLHTAQHIADEYEDRGMLVDLLSGAASLVVNLARVYADESDVSEDAVWGSISDRAQAAISMLDDISRLAETEQGDDQK